MDTRRKAPNGMIYDYELHAARVQHYLPINLIFGRKITLIKLGFYQPIENQ